MVLGYFSSLPLTGRNIASRHTRPNMEVWTFRQFSPHVEHGLHILVYRLPHAEEMHPVQQCGRVSTQERVVGVEGVPAAGLVLLERPKFAFSSESSPLPSSVVLR